MKYEDQSWLIRKFIEGAYDYEIMNEYLLRCTANFTDKKVDIQIIVLDSIDKKQIDDITAALTEIVTCLAHNVEYNEEFIYVNNPLDIKDYDPLPISLYRYAIRNNNDFDV